MRSLMNAAFLKSFACKLTRTWMFSYCPDALFVFSLPRNGQKGGGEGGRGQVSAPLHTGSQAAPGKEALHRGLLLDPRCKTRWRFFKHSLRSRGVWFLCDRLMSRFKRFQGDDPDQQSDSEEGSTKGEPQVGRSRLTEVGARESRVLDLCVISEFSSGPFSCALM